MLSALRCNPVNSPSQIWTWNTNLSLTGFLISTFENWVITYQIFAHDLSLMLCVQVWFSFLKVVVVEIRCFLIKKIGQWCWWIIFCIDIYLVVLFNPCCNLGVVILNLILLPRFSEPSCLLFTLPPPFLSAWVAGEENWRDKRQRSKAEIRTIYWKWQWDKKNEQ